MAESTGVELYRRAGLLLPGYQELPALAYLCHTPVVVSHVTARYLIVAVDNRLVGILLSNDGSHGRRISVRSAKTR